MKYDMVFALWVFGIHDKAMMNDAPEIGEVCIAKGIWNISNFSFE